MRLAFSLSIFADAGSSCRQQGLHQQQGVLKVTRVTQNTQTKSVSFHRRRFWFIKILPISRYHRRSIWRLIGLTKRVFVLK